MTTRQERIEVLRQKRNDIRVELDKLYDAISRMKGEQKRDGDELRRLLEEEAREQ